MTSASSADPHLLSDAHIKVRHSKVHGNGVFAARKIPAGARIIEYQGKRISEKQAEKRFGQDPDNPHHTFFFSLESGKLIDGGDEGNDARWINHSCEPNCEAQEEKGRVYISALRDIVRGEELNYDYGLVIDEKMSKALKKAYACRCGSDACRGTMLAVKKKKKKAAKKADSATKANAGGKAKDKKKTQAKDKPKQHNKKAADKASDNADMK